MDRNGVPTVMEIQMMVEKEFPTKERMVTSEYMEMLHRRKKMEEKKHPIIEIKIEEVKTKKRRYPKEFRKIAKEIRKGKDCQLCGANKLLTVHHIDKDIENNTIENLVVLCWYCHAKHHNHMRTPPKWLK